MPQGRVVLILNVIFSGDNSVDGNKTRELHRLPFEWAAVILSDRVFPLPDSGDSRDQEKEESGGVGGQGHDYVCVTTDFDTYILYLLIL